LTKEGTILVESLNLEPYARILCYPRITHSDLEHKIRELSQLGVEAIDFVGKIEISGVPIIGKGCVGVVVRGHRKGERVAIKILRSDANRQNLTQEAKMLKLANTVHVGPFYVDSSERILIMQHIDGSMISQWADQLPADKRAIQSVLERIVDDCFKIDQISLDHGELSRAAKHVIIDNKQNPTLLDFETASLNRRASNVTSICQYLFLGFQIGHKIRNAIDTRATAEIIETLKEYKRRPNLDSLNAVKSACGLRPGNLG
jgi:putative serine/threonine protein kinase